MNKELNVKSELLLRLAQVQNRKDDLERKFNIKIPGESLYEVVALDHHKLSLLTLAQGGDKKQTIKFFRC